MTNACKPPQKTDIDTYLDWIFFFFEKRAWPAFFSKYKQGWRQHLQVSWPRDIWWSSSNYRKSLTEVGIGISREVKACTLKVPNFLNFHHAHILWIQMWKNLSFKTSKLSCPWTTFSFLLHIKPMHLTMSLKAFSMAPITRLSCEIFFSVKKRVGWVLGEPGAPAAPRSEAALVSARWDVGVRWWLIGSSPRQVGGCRFGVQRISITSWRCRAMWWCRRREATTATPEPAWPSNNAQ